MELKRNAYFVPGEGISREVITADICKYLDNDAVVRPGEYQGQKGYILHAYRNLTSAMLEDLRADSKKWEQEKRQKIATQQQQRQPNWGQPAGVSAPDYTDSRTHQLRQQAAYPEDRNSPSPSIPQANSYNYPSAAISQIPQQTPSPSQFAPAAPSPYTDSSQYSTQHQNNSYNSLPTQSSGFTAPVASPVNNFGQVQSPEHTAFGPHNRPQGFQNQPLPQNNDFDHQPRQANPNQFDFSTPGNNNNMNFANGRMPPPSVAPGQFAPQPPHTAPPIAQRDPPYNSSFPDQRTDTRGPDSRGMKRPFREQSTDQRRFTEQRNFPNDSRRRR